MAKDGNNRDDGLTMSHATIAPCQELMTEAELIEFLRIPIVSKAGDYGHVVEHLKRTSRMPDRIPQTDDPMAILDYCAQPHDLTREEALTEE